VRDVDRGNVVAVVTDGIRVSPESVPMLALVVGSAAHNQVTGSLVGRCIVSPTGMIVLNGITNIAVCQFGGNNADQTRPLRQSMRMSPGGFRGPLGKFIASAELTHQFTVIASSGHASAKIRQDVASQRPVKFGIF